MEYKNPELIAIGEASAVIQSSLSKMNTPPDSLLGKEFPGTTSAYEAVE